jgi:hypothetical protein
MKTIKTKFGTAALNISHYTEGGMTAIRLFDVEDHFPIGTLTSNFPDALSKLNKGEFFVKGWAENETFIEDCRNSGLFVDTGRRYKSGYVTAEIWRFKE